MSLQLAAQHLAAKGRGPDTTLVHMSPGEVASLQSLARANGGTLTVNPDTGLPEAGFLSAILPIVAGAALGPAGLGLSAMQAALATGAVGTLATGSLRKGLMAGLGAYGGAGLMGSVTGAGNAAASGMASAEAAAAGEAAARQALVPSGIPAAPVAPVAPVATPAVAPTNVPLGIEEQNLLSRSFGADMYPGGYGTTVATPAPVATATPAPSLEAAAVRAPGTAPTYEQMRAAGFSDADIAQSAREYASNLKGTAQDPFSQTTRDAMGSPVKTGLSAVMKDPKQLFTKENMKYGLAALAPLMLQEQKNEAPAGSGPNPYQYAYNPGRVANPQRAGGVGEYEYFRPSYTRLAAGGPVQEMSDRNDQETFVANGGQFFADGGDVKLPSYVYDPVTQTYKDVTNVQPVQTVTQMPSMRREYYGEGDGGEGPTPPNMQNAFNSQGMPNAITTGLISAANAMNITSPIQGAIQGIPGALISGGPLGILGGAILGNAAQIGQMTGFSNIAEGNSNAGITPGLGSLSMDQGAHSEGQVDTGPVGPTGADNDDAAIGAAIAAAAAANNGVEVGGPIRPGDATGVDVGSVSGADSGVSDNSGGDLARGGLAAAYARGGYNLGGYSDGGRLLRGPGDGVSDSIPATIAGKRPARLADGEFVVPARIVSELGNGSTEAGARKLYAMMDRIQKARRKSVGKGKVAVNSRADKLLPA